MVTFSDSKFHEGSFLVYFNGIEIPAISASVSMGVWSIPTATVNVIPDVTLAGLGREDRIQVAIFYLDGVHTPDDPQFRLLFDGEITGWSYSNTARGRAMCFNCIAHASIFQEMYPFFMMGLDSMLTAAIAATNPNAVISAQVGLTFPSSFLYAGFDTSGKRLERPYDIVENILRAIIGTKEQSALGSVVASGFYARYLKRVNMPNRWVPSPLIEQADGRGGLFPVLKAIQSESVVDAVAQRAGEFGNGNSFWGVLQNLFNMTYYEIGAITTPPIAKVSLNEGERGTIVGKPDKPNQPGSSNPNRLVQYITKPQWMFGVPPMCNAVFPSMITELSYNEEYRGQPTRVGINDEFIVGLMGSEGAASSLSVLHGGYPDQFAAELEKKFGAFGETHPDVLRSGKNFLVWPEEYFRGPTLEQHKLPNWFNYLDDKLQQDTTAVQGTTEASKRAAEQSLFEKRKLLMKTYAHYEYVRIRGSAKRGGVSMIFNPYIIPGFPTMIFSDVASGQNYHAYVNNVTHTLTASSVSTQMGYTFAQTFDDLLWEVSKARKENADIGDILAAPLNPVNSVRNLTQIKENAEAYFTLLLHQNQAYTGSKLKRATFDYRQAINLVLPDSKEPVPLTDTARVAASLQRYVAVQPSAQYAEAFKSPDAALSLVSRPICTLEEYIDFQGAKGTRKMPILPTDKTRMAKGAKYYAKILELVPGPGAEPPLLDPKTNGLVSPFPYDTRTDWETRLMNYRIKVIHQTHPQEA